MSHMCEKSARPSRECSELVKMLSFSCTVLRSRLPTLDWRGTARFSGKAVRMIPIGLNWATSSPPFREPCNKHEVVLSRMLLRTYPLRTCCRRTVSNLSLSVSLLLVFLLLAQPSQRKSCSSRLIVSMSLRCTCCKLRTCCLMLHTCNRSGYINNIELELQQLQGFCIFYIPQVVNLIPRDC